MRSDGKLLSPDEGSNLAVSNLRARAKCSRHTSKVQILIRTGSEVMHHLVSSIRHRLGTRRWRIR
jgi:hypothetical protein